MREFTAPQVQPVYQRLRGHLATAGQPGVQVIVDGTPEGQP